MRQGRMESSAEGQKKSIKKVRIRNKARENDRERFDGKRLVVLKRDGYKCVKCGMTQDNHMKRFGASLNIDHIDGNGRGCKKQNNSLENLQTLCFVCHSIKDGLRRKATKLNVETVKDIKRMFLNGVRPCDVIRKFGFQKASWLVYCIYAGLTWKHVIIEERMGEK